MRPVVKVLSGLLKKEVVFVDDCVGEKATQAVNNMKAGDLVLLENLRFYPGEDKNDAGICQTTCRALRRIYR